MRRTDRVLRQITDMMTFLDEYPEEITNSDIQKVLQSAADEISQLDDELTDAKDKVQEFSDYTFHRKDNRRGQL